MNQMIDSNVYYHQSNKINTVIREKRAKSVNRKGVILHHDNKIAHKSHDLLKIIET